MLPGARRQYIDLTRGLAVLVMIEAHTVDAWTRLADRSTPAYRNLIILGGFAAPLFLWLAGLATTLGAEAALAKTANRRWVCQRICTRGLLIFGLAFLFRLQAFVVSPGNSLVSLLRVDILNVMGPSIVATGLLWAASRRPAARLLTFGLGATAVAMATPLVRGAQWVDGLPAVLQWYLRPAGEHTVFTFFPWSGFVFAGGWMGVLVASVGTRPSQHRLQLLTIVGGIVLIGFGFYAASLPSLYPESSFWTTSPTYFAIRVGVLMVTLAVAYGIQLALGAWAPVQALQRLGRSSLFVYWIHVELVYGYASWPVRRHLSVFQTLIAYVIFCLLMYGAVALRDRAVRAWSARKTGAPAEVASS